MRFYQSNFAHFVVQTKANERFFLEQVIVFLKKINFPSKIDLVLSASKKLILYLQIPEPLKRTWSDPKKSNRYGRGCMQSPSILTNSFYLSEDCLFLNVYVPCKYSKSMKGTKTKALRVETELYFICKFLLLFLFLLQMNLQKSVVLKGNQF